MSLVRNKETPLVGSRALLEASGDDLRVLLALLEDGSLSGDKLAAAAGCSPSRAEGARAYWRECGILMPDAPAQAREESYTLLGQELADVITRRGARPFIEDCQLLLGHTMNQGELDKVFRLMEDYCVDESYVLTLLAFCKELQKCSIHYLETTAIDMINRGITTLPALDAYIGKRRATAPTERLVRKIFGIYERPLTKPEKAAVDKWALYGYGEEEIGLAYDITIDITGKSAVSYADKNIVSKWFAAGCRTLHDILAYEETERKKRAAAYAEKKAAKKSAPKGARPEEIHSFDTEDFFQKALERSYSPKEEKK